MSDGQLHAPEPETCSPGYAHHRLEAGVSPWPLDRALGGVALFRIFLFHAGLSALLCGLDEIRGFLRGFPHSVFSCSGRLPDAGRQWRLCCSFSSSLLYYPLNQEAYVMFVYPFAVLCLFVTRLRTVFLVLIAMMAGVVAETRYLGRPFGIAENVLLLLRDFWVQ